MQLLIDRDEGQPLHRQIESQIRTLIENGTLGLGSRLPASRNLARTLGVNRATVCTAYDALVASGYVEACVGRGTEVVRRSVESRPAKSAGTLRVDWSGLLSEALDPQPPALERPSGPGTPGPGRIDFSALVPDESLFPVDRLRRALDDVLRRDGQKLLQYGPPMGHLPFREVLAQRMRLVGMTVDVDDLLIVNGAQQGLDLFCKALLNPGDVVLVESPTYANLLPVLRLSRAEMIGIPMTSEGIDLARLESVLSSRRVKFLYTMPHFQNPTGISTTLAHRKELLAVASRHGLTILEDGYEEDLRWDGGEVLPLRALDTSGRVCYVGTFSKGLCPGFRVGWLVAHRDLLAHLAYLKRTTDYHTPLVLQAALAEFIRRGEYDSHLRRLRRIYRARMAAAGAALAAHLPPEVRWRVPQGGYCLWVELPPGISVEELGARAGRDGVQMSLGRPFFTADPGYGCFRLSISRTSVEEIESGIAILGRHLHELTGHAARGEARAALPYI